MTAALKKIAARLGVTLLDLLTSKKAIAAAVAAIVNLVVQDDGSRQLITAAIMSYIVGQGIADHGAAIAEKKLGIDGAQPLPIGVVDAKIQGAPPAGGLGK
jgi:hypothetical protein